MMINTILLIGSFFINGNSNLIKMQDKNDPSQVAIEYVKSFQNGAEFIAPTKGIIIKGHPDSSALKILSESLLTEKSSVRDNIVNLLVSIGTESDELAKMGALVIRNKSVVQILSTAGLAKTDIARETSMNALRTFVPESYLTEFQNNFKKAIETKPSDEALLLIAKSKTLSAKVDIEKLAELDKWKNMESLKIAQAALGNSDIVLTFINKLKTASSKNQPKEFIQSLKPLSLIGTSQALKAIAENLRTTLIFELPGAFRKSVRLDVLDALLYNFPDQPELSSIRIISEEDYIEAERFCIENLKISYKNPRPPFLTYFGFPSH